MSGYDQKSTCRGHANGTMLNAHAYHLQKTGKCLTLCSLLCDGGASLARVTRKADASLRAKGLHLSTVIALGFANREANSLQTRFIAFSFSCVEYFAYFRRFLLTLCIFPPS